MNIQELIKDFAEKKIHNTKLNENAVGDYIRETLEVKPYLPFRQKRMVVETVVAENIEMVDGIKKVDSINQYIAFVVAMLQSHTNLEFSNDPVADYDILAESGLLPLIIEEFRADYNECDILLKMELASELEDNNVNVIISRFTNGILEKLDGVGDALKSALGNFNINDIFGNSFTEEDLAKLSSFLDTVK